MPSFFLITSVETSELVALKRKKDQIVIIESENGNVKACGHHTIQHHPPFKQKIIMITGQLEGKPISATLSYQSSAGGYLLNTQSTDANMFSKNICYS